jgi:hypothetical protein
MPAKTRTKTKPPTSGSLIKQVGAICLALPETTRADYPGTCHAAFRVRKKVFAYFLDNHHGDGIIAVCFKGALGEQQDMIERDPKRYYRPDYIGPRGWVGLRLDVGKVSWSQVERHIRSSYILTAPKTLARALL